MSFSQTPVHSSLICFESSSSLATEPTSSPVTVVISLNIRMSLSPFPSLLHSSLHTARNWAPTKPAPSSVPPSALQSSMEGIISRQDLD